MRVAASIMLQQPCFPVFSPWQGLPVIRTLKLGQCIAALLGAHHCKEEG